MATCSFYTNLKECAVLLAYGSLGQAWANLSRECGGGVFAAVALDAFSSPNIAIAHKAVEIRPLPSKGQFLNFPSNDHFRKPINSISEAVWFPHCGGCSLRSVDQSLLEELLQRQSTLIIFNQPSGLIMELLPQIVGARAGVLFIPDIQHDLFIANPPFAVKLKDGVIIRSWTFKAGGESATVMLGKFIHEHP